MNEQDKKPLLKLSSSPDWPGWSTLPPSAEAINSTVDQGLALGNTDEFGVSRRVQDAAKFIAQEAVRRIPAQYHQGSAP